MKEFASVVVTLLVALACVVLAIIQGIHGDGVHATILAALAFLILGVEEVRARLPF